MSKTMVIGKPYIEEIDYDGKKVRLCCKINRSDKDEFELFYEFDEEYREYIHSETLDSFFIALIPYAMEMNYDIELDYPVSSQIYYNLVMDFMPTLSKFQDYFNLIKVQKNIIDPPLISSNNAVATGVSCGVDSLYTILTHYNTLTDKILPSSCALTHLVIMNAGSCGVWGGKKSYEWFRKEEKDAERLCHELNLKLISIHTNLTELYERDHAHSGTLRMCGCISALQKLIGKYYLASGYELEHFSIDNDDAKYGFYSTRLASNRNIQFYLYGNDASRDDRVSYIANSDIAHKYLNVCWNGKDNCSRCEKCLRTMGSLYSIGKLSEFYSVFNVEDFYAHKTERIAEMLWYRKQHKELYDDFLNKIKKNESLLYYKARIHYFFNILPKKIAICIVKKILKQDTYLKLKSKIKK